MRALAALPREPVQLLLELFERRTLLEKLQVVVFNASSGANNPTNPVKTRPLHDGNVVSEHTELPNTIVKVSNPTGTLSETDWMVLPSDRPPAPRGGALCQRGSPGPAAKRNPRDAKWTPSGRGSAASFFQNRCRTHCTRSTTIQPLLSSVCVSHMCYIRRRVRVGGM